MTNATIFFDMDGTIADLYGVENWLTYLTSNNPFPYKNAKPLVRLCTLALILNKLQKQGYKLGIISWLAKNSDANYDKAVTIAKKNWLKTHLKSVHFDEIHIVKYGTPKQNFIKTDKDILFDDEEPNRKAWTGNAFRETEIFETLKRL